MNNYTSKEPLPIIYSLNIIYLPFFFTISISVWCLCLCGNSKTSRNIIWQQGICSVFFFFLVRILWVEWSFWHYCTIYLWRWTRRERLFELPNFRKCEIQLSQMEIHLKISISYSYSIPYRIFFKSRIQLYIGIYWKCFKFILLNFYMTRTIEYKN